jgi:uncharacterized LabA/DUF88 family protein
MNKTTFLIDGFNLYHSLKRADRDLGRACTRWLDLRALCASFLYAIGNNAQIEEIYYFSALAKHLEATHPEVTQRHLKYIKCLEATGVIVELGRFKPKDSWCPHCNISSVKYEEKETDVAISVKLMELFFQNSCDTAVLVTGDTDIAPAVRTAKRFFPQKAICFLFPYRRKNNELDKLSSASFHIKKERYLKYQFPDPFPLPSGREISKPAKW